MTIFDRFHIWPKTVKFSTGQIYSFIFSMRVPQKIGGKIPSKQIRADVKFNFGGKNFRLEVEKFWIVIDLFWRSNLHSNNSNYFVREICRPKLNLTDYKFDSQRSNLLPCQSAWNTSNGPYLTYQQNNPTV